MTARIVVSHDVKLLTQLGGGAEVLVTLFSGAEGGRAGIGSQFVAESRRLAQTAPVAAWDLLAFSLAVLAADCFVSRTAAADGWTREIQLAVTLVDPQRFDSAKPRLEAMLQFLTGDLWQLEFHPGGKKAPPLNRNAVALDGLDEVVLYSGGLDSLVGVLDAFAVGAKPLLVSHAAAKERDVQDRVAKMLPPGAYVRFAANAAPSWPGHQQELSQRSRSLLFLAMAIFSAHLLLKSGSAGKVVVPENGLIALNPPLTRRRIGSLSTRTTHPFFLGQLRSVLSDLELGVEIENPYELQTKGEMLAACADQDRLLEALPSTVSCGKWKRRNRQCGRCVPCLIRRAGVLHAGLLDKTSYQFRNLKAVASAPDVMAVRIAAREWKSGKDLRQWAMANGPLPGGAKELDEYSEVIGRGMQELAHLLHVEAVQ